MDFIIKHKNLVITILINILAIILSNALLTAWNNAELNYDRSNIKSYECLITTVKLNITDDGTETKVTFRDPNNNLQTLFVSGNKMSKYIEGDTITVYSEDERHFELTEQGIVSDNVGGLFYLLGASLISMFVIIMSGVLCGWKGAVFSLFLIVFSLISG